jgi:hypothetical protein
MYFIFIYENRIMKPVEIVLWSKEWGRKTEGVNVIKINRMHICKCHNVLPVHTNKKFLIKLENNNLSSCSVQETNKYHFQSKEIHCYTATLDQIINNKSLI